MIAFWEFSQLKLMLSEFTNNMIRLPMTYNIEIFNLVFTSLGILLDHLPFTLFHFHDLKSNSTNLLKQILPLSIFNLTMICVIIYMYLSEWSVIVFMGLWLLKIYCVLFMSVVKLHYNFILNGIPLWCTSLITIYMWTKIVMFSAF